MQNLDQSSLPHWMQLFAFWASLVLTLAGIIGAAAAAIRRPKLHVHLTEEIFFRLSDFGEGLFANPVLLAANGPVLISSVTAVLNKTDSAIKQFPLKVLFFGEKVRGAGPIADHFFHSTSPIAYVAQSVPQRAVYLCVQDKYQDASRQALSDFQTGILNYKTQLTDQRIVDPTSITQEQVFREVNQRVESSLGKMMDLVQLEPGAYTLCLTITYNNPSAWFSIWQKEAKSEVSFVVGKDVRDQWRAQLRQVLMVGAMNLILDQSMPLTYPEYRPSCISAKQPETV